MGILGDSCHGTNSTDTYRKNGKEEKERKKEKGKGGKNTSHCGFLAILNSTGGIDMEMALFVFLLRKTPPQSRFRFRCIALLLGRFFCSRRGLSRQTVLLIALRVCAVGGRVGHQTLSSARFPHGVKVRVCHGFLRREAVLVGLAAVG